MISFSCEPIGVFSSFYPRTKYELPRQPEDRGVVEGKISLRAKVNFEQALEGLEGFDRIWVLFWFDQVFGWKTKVQVPRAVRKQGLFATRSPHRPSPIGLSCVKLIKIQGRDLFVEGVDLLDKTPILDIKPYIPSYDSFPTAKCGWLDEVAPPFTVTWGSMAEEKASFIDRISPELGLYPKVTFLLKRYAGPSPYNRIRLLGKDKIELAFKTWRLYADLNVEDRTLLVTDVASGYDPDTLEGKKSSKWDDVPLHREFVSHFSYLPS